jgi:hypothetical protein
MLEMTDESFKDESAAMDIDKAWRWLLNILWRKNIEFNLPVLISRDPLHARQDIGIFVDKLRRLHPFLRHADKAFADGRGEFAVRKKLSLNGITCHDFTSFPGPLL